MLLLLFNELFSFTSSNYCYCDHSWRWNLTIFNVQVNTLPSRTNGFLIRHPWLVEINYFALYIRLKKRLRFFLEFFQPVSKKVINTHEISLWTVRYITEKTKRFKSISAWLFWETEKCNSHSIFNKTN